MSAPAPSDLPSCRGYRYPAEIISPAVWLYSCFILCLRDVEELMAERGAAVMHETMRAWARRSARATPADVRSRRFVATERT